MQVDRRRHGLCSAAVSIATRDGPDVCCMCCMSQEVFLRIVCVVALTEMWRKARQRANMT
ncbi:hypothetical protein BOTBODRAFT_215037 [Botryobasidium botryosum FD-172 SS1]|uniref:Uncharacterized protein n=1 Tax=Botryobasidium botryosum (strain FD-172 SS1) TaxID=930990 RepID=A0A067NDM0_BOTB1|nr:hypothetical protein BOTBODRAFT_215037 [Botryobasidium botryosum FD-172 SS1]